MPPTAAPETETTTVAEEIGDVFETELGDAVDDALGDGEDDAAGGEGLDDLVGGEGGEPTTTGTPAADPGDGTAELRRAFGAMPRAPKAGERARGPDGRFLPTPEEVKAAADKAAAAAPAATPAAEPAKPAETPKWEALGVNVDRQAVPIEEAKVSRANGHVYIAVPEGQFDRFQQRLGRGIALERQQNAIIAERKELEARKSAPAPKSDAQIESEIVLEMIRPFLPDILDEKDVQLLELRVENAKHKARTEFSRSESERIAAARAVPWEQQRLDTLATTMVALVAHAPELKGLTGEQIREVYEQEFVPVQEALIRRDAKGQITGNTKWMFDRLKLKAASSKSAAPSPTPAPSTGGAPAPTPATTAAPTPATAAAERFNKAVETAPKPRTTSVKDGRTGRAPGATPRAERPAPKRSPRDEQQSAEDEWRRTERAFLNSGNTFDFATAGEE